MKIVTYDFEVFKYDWLVVMKDYQTGTYTEIHNDNEAFMACMDDDTVYVGFNSKHYDQFIAKAVCMNSSPGDIKKVNDYIIGGKQGWDCPFLKNHYWIFSNVDIKDDMQAGLSLKAIEGHLFMNIEESDVDFNLDRPLTESEIAQTFHYCRHDVDAAEKILTLRKDYLTTKINIGKMAGIHAAKAMAMTNAKLTAALLGATPKTYNDERNYQYPACLKTEVIPQEVFDFFNRMKDESIPDDVLFKSKHKLMIGDCEVTLGYGGIHGAIRNYVFGGDVKYGQESN